jgi:flagellar L-ring protein precursor FlgH
MLILLTACSNTIERIKRIGKAPTMAHIRMPEKDEESYNAEKAKIDKQREYMRRTNSLWSTGSITFFRDNRAWKVGDIVRIDVSITDSAKLANQTTRGRGPDKESLGITGLFGKQAAIAKTLSKQANAANLLGITASSSHSGSGNIARTEAIQTQIAALVTKVLQNGNLVIQGRQEVLVNSELREVKVAGVIRPRDIASDNSIQSNQIAEARISYGGRGVVSDVQDPRYGSQLIDAVTPF